LPEELDLIIEKMVVGQVSAVTRTLRGYHIIFVAKTRSLAADPKKTKLDMIQTSIPLKDTNSLQSATNYALEVKSCSDANTRGEAAGYVLTALNKIAVGDLSPTIATAIASLKKGQTTSPIQSAQNLMLFTLCKRIKDRGHLPTRKEIKNRLGQARLDLIAARKLRDLRSAAFIDIRL
jgi:parvulin-like peptidyl-prolyl isomerase